MSSSDPLNPVLGASWHEAGLDDADLAAARAASAPLAERLNLREALAPYAGQRWRAEHSGRPTLYLDDFSGIPFLNDITGVEEYQHRSRMRAGDGDLFAASTPAVEGFEAYCRETLGLGSPEFLLATSQAGPMAVARGCGEGEVFQRLVAHARRAGGLQIHPYMGIDEVWGLAARIAGAARVEVSVLAPPPPATWVANDKGLLSEVVRCVLGPDFVVETHAARDPGELARILVEMSARHARVGLKRTRCASGMGNAHYDLSTLGGDPAAEIEQTIRAFLGRTEWDGREEVLAVAWEETELSPSTQMWIPPEEAGPPRLDGIYEQILYDAERVFLGSRPSSLPAALNQELARAALKVSAGLQALGYVGRCSYDHLVLGDPAGEHCLRFTESNGRWGGTSTPMHIVDRVCSGPRPPYRAQDVVHADLVGMPFLEVLRRLEGELYRPRTGEGRYVLYNVGPLAKSGKLDVIALAKTQAEAEEALTERLPRLLGLS